MPASLNALVGRERELAAEFADGACFVALAAVRDAGMVAAGAQASPNP